MAFGSKRRLVTLSQGVRSPVARALALARTRLVDVVGLGDSHQMQGSHGYDDGWGYGIIQAGYRQYASPVVYGYTNGTGYTEGGANGAGANSGLAAELEAYALPKWDDSAAYAYLYQSATEPLYYAP